MSSPSNPLKTKENIDAPIKITNTNELILAVVIAASEIFLKFSSFLNKAKIAAPADPSTEEGRLYLKEINTSNNALAVKLQKAGSVVEVELTSPGCVCECGSTDGAKDPTFDFAKGIMIVELYCGHSYEMDIPNLRRVR